MKKIYKHIVSEKIQDIDTPHPLHNQRDKSFFIKLLYEDLGINTDLLKYSDSKMFFLFTYDNIDYFIFIESPDGGGRDITQKDTSKKISIPFNAEYFDNALEENKNVLVINIYIPLDENKNLDIDKRIYLIIDPKEIYSKYKVVKNPSSRWVKLEIILDVIKNKNNKTNSRENVYVIHSTKIKTFFSDFIKEQYKEIQWNKSKEKKINQLNHELEKLNLKDYWTYKHGYNKYRSIFRDELILKRGTTKCEIHNCKIDVKELMRASHIKPVNKIIDDNLLTPVQKKNEIIDSNNGFLFCPNHDLLFDRFLITFNKNGQLIVSKYIKDKINYFDLKIGDKLFSIPNEDVIKYLNFHNSEFSKKEKENN